MSAAFEIVGFFAREDEEARATPTRGEKRVQNDGL